MFGYWPRSLVKAGQRIRQPCGHRGFNSGVPSAVSACEVEDANDNNAYLDRLLWQAEQFPDSLADEIVNGTEVYADDDAETVYIGTLYVPSNAAWQRFVILDYTPVTLGGDNEIPELTPEGQPVDKPWSASYERTETLDFSYTINTDKIQLETLEKVDGAGIDIAPILDGIPSDINGGSWTITPSGKQSVTTDRSHTGRQLPSQWRRCFCHMDGALQCQQVGIPKRQRNGQQ